MEAVWTKLIAPGMIDTSLKLQLLLRFYQHTRLCSDVLSISEWLREPPWEVGEALDALAGIGFLTRIEGPRSTHYRLDPSLEVWEVLEQLARAYDDPLQRDAIHTALRHANDERRFQAWLAQAHGATEEPLLVAEQGAG